jgi:hypothetical protein
MRENPRHDGARFIDRYVGIAHHGNLTPATRAAVQDLLRQHVLDLGRARRVALRDHGKRRGESPLLDVVAGLACRPSTADVDTIEDRPVPSRGIGTRTIRSLEKRDYSCRRIRRRLDVTVI